MSNISELREQVCELHKRLEIVEGLLLDLIQKNKAQIQDFPSISHEIGEVRTPIGFKK